MVSIELLKTFRFDQIMAMYPLAREFEERSLEIPSMICIHTN